MYAKDFGWALNQLRAGARVRRQGWNGKGMFLIFVPGSTFTITADRPLGQAMPARVGETMDYQPHVDMFTAQGSMVPWLCSQSDMLAEDWETVDEPAVSG